MSLLVVAAFWAILLAAFFARGPQLIYLFFATVPLGSFAAVPTTVTGGLTVIAAPLVALAFVVRMLGTREGIDFAITAALLPRRLALLFAFWIVAILATLFMPRLFAGAVEVIPFRGVLSRTDLLRPSPQNISQIVYLTVSVLVVFAFARFLRNPNNRQPALNALVFGGGIAVGTGLLDYATQFAPIEPLLAPFRTATYALATGVEVLDGKRVVGLMPEASSFAGVCLSFLTAIYFLRRSIEDDRLREIVAPLLVVALIVMLWLAKSTSGYFGLAVFLALAGLEWLWRAAALARGDPRRRGLGQEFWVAFAAAMAVVLVVLVEIRVLDPFFALVDRMVFQKTSSPSWEERGLWRMTAWTAFVETFGLGVGMGATRSSSAHVGMLASVGLLGALFYYGFLVQTFARRAPPGDAIGEAMISAVRWALVPTIMVDIFVGSADFGPFNGFLYGLAAAVAIGAPGARRSPLPARTARAGPAPAFAARTARIHDLRSQTER